MQRRITVVLVLSALLTYFVIFILVKHAHATPITRNGTIVSR